MPDLSIYECEHLTWERHVGKPWLEGKVLLVCVACGWAPIRPFPDNRGKGPSAVDRLGHLAEGP